MHSIHGRRAGAAGAGGGALPVTITVTTAGGWGDFGQGAAHPRAPYPVASL